eukprot:190591-Pyramimonas_sp.AAC.1
MGSLFGGGGALPLRPWGLLELRLGPRSALAIGGEVAREKVMGESGRPNKGKPLADARTRHKPGMNAEPGDAAAEVPRVASTGAGAQVEVGPPAAGGPDAGRPCPKRPAH